MTSSVWLAAVEFIADFEGLIGALFGAYVGFFGNYFTARHTSQIEAEKVSRETARDIRIRISAGTADVLTAIMKAGSDGFRDYRLVDDLSDQLVLFSVREMHDYPNAAKWARMQANEIRETAKPDAHFVALPFQAYRIRDQLFDWVKEDYRDDFFDVNADEKSIRQKVIESLESNLYVKRIDSVDPTDEDMSKMHLATEQAGLSFVRR